MLGHLGHALIYLIVVTKMGMKIVSKNRQGNRQEKRQKMWKQSKNRQENRHKNRLDKNRLQKQARKSSRIKIVRKSSNNLFVLKRCQHNRDQFTRNPCKLTIILQFLRHQEKIEIFYLCRQYVYLFESGSNMGLICFQVYSLLIAYRHFLAKIPKKFSERTTFNKYLQVLCLATMQRTLKHK